MSVERIPNWQYPHINPSIDDPDSLHGIIEWTKTHHLEHEEESVSRIEDFENLVIDTLTVTDWVVQTSLKLNYATASRLLATSASKFAVSTDLS